MRKIDNIYSACLFKVLVAFLGLLFLCLGCAATTGGNLSASSADGVGVTWGMTFVNEVPENMLSVEELTRGADLIARAEVVSSRPVCFKFNNVTYYQLSLLKIKEIIKGSCASEVISVYAREDNAPAKRKSAYELCDEVLVFLKKNNDFYFTFGGAYGQMPICDERITNWRRIKKGKLEDNIIIHYNEAKQFIIITLYISSLNRKINSENDE